MADSAPEYAVDALGKAIAARAATPPRGGERGFGESAFTLPSLSFKFKAPSFLRKWSRWVLFVLLLVVATLALILAWDMVNKTSDSDGAEWVWPPIMTLIVAAFALGFAFATVMGFGEVELSTSIGDVASGSGDGLAVSTTVPPDKATGIGVDVEIDATFSEAIDPASLTAASFVLRKQTEATPVPSSVSTESDGKTGRLKPAAALQASSVYEVEITTAVKSASGTALAAAKKWTFTTNA